LGAVSLERVLLALDESGDARNEGGAITRGETIYFDPAFLIGLDDRITTFVVAHEVGEMKFPDFVQEFAETVPANDYAEFEKKVTSLRDLHDNFADEFAIRKMYESGWILEEVAMCLSAYRSHQESYLEKHGRRETESTLLSDWLEVTSLVARKLWEDYHQGYEWRFTP
jgi:hypothetical protein